MNETPQNTVENSSNNAYSVRQIIPLTWKNRMAFLRCALSLTSKAELFDPAVKDVTVNGVSISSDPPRLEAEQQEPRSPGMDRYSIPLRDGRRFVYYGPTNVTRDEMGRLLGWLACQLIVIADDAPSVGRGTENHAQALLTENDSSLLGKQREGKKNWRLV